MPGLCAAILFQRLQIKRLCFTRKESTCACSETLRAENRVENENWKNFDQNNTQVLTLTE